MLLLLFVVSWLVKDVASEFRLYGNTTAEYGGEAHYGCTAPVSQGVLQVTWQRLFKGESLENLATYSKRFGQQVNEPYRRKVVFTEASLNASSITLRNITWGDEGCYICSFNAYPDGSKRKEICLAVKGISDISTNHVPSPGDGETTHGVFTCSATGKPAPTIDWDISPGVTIEDTTGTSVVENTDKTFTSSRNVTLRIPVGLCVHVDCVLNNRSTGQRRKRIFSPCGANNKGEERLGRLHVIAVATISVVAITICIVAVFLKKKRWRSRRRDGGSTPESTLCSAQTFTTV